MSRSHPTRPLAPARSDSEVECLPTIIVSPTPVASAELHIRARGSKARVKVLRPPWIIPEFPLRGFLMSEYGKLCQVSYQVRRWGCPSSSQRRG